MGHQSFNFCLIILLIKLNFNELQGTLNIIFHKFHLFGHTMGLMFCIKETTFIHVVTFYKIFKVTFYKAFFSFKKKLFLAYF
jgi:hypothetical protein